MNILKSFLSLNPFFGLAISLSFILIFLVFYVVNKLYLIALLKKNINYLNKIVQELEGQVKSAFKSDVELKRFQEESEESLNELILLKDLIIASVPILDEDRLFSHINERFINDLGFKKGAILNFADLEVKINIGFENECIEEIKNLLRVKKDVLKVSALLSVESEIDKRKFSFLSPKNTLIAPIKARKSIYAVFVASGLFAAKEIVRPVKETFSSVCMYLGQCLDNIKTFEDLYRAKDDLEKKVKERTNELVKSLREIEAISKMKSDFISSVSHELRTPLTSVKGFSSLLVEEKFGKLPLEAKKRLEKIDENVNKLVDMVNTLLDISRIESGKVEIKIAPADIVKLIKEVTDFLSPQIQSKKINLVLEVPEKSIVYLDKNLIERALINIINNAIKYTPPYGQITVRCVQEKQQDIISVSDTGCGMDEADLEKIFQEFFRVNNPQNLETKGSGLGLALAKGIIDTHQEKIWVESAIGEGTTFYFTLKLGKND